MLFELLFVYSISGMLVLDNIQLNTSCQDHYYAVISNLDIETMDGSINVTIGDNVWYNSTFVNVKNITSTGVLLKCDNCTINYNLSFTCLPTCDYSNCYDCLIDQSCGWCSSENICKPKTLSCDFFSVRCTTPFQTPTPDPTPTQIPSRCDFKLVKPNFNDTLYLGRYYYPDWTSNCHIDTIKINIVENNFTFTIEKGKRFAIYEAQYTGNYDFKLYHENNYIDTYTFYIHPDICRELTVCDQDTNCIFCNNTCVGNANIERCGFVNVSLIVGVVCGSVGLIILCVLIFVIYYIRKRRRDRVTELVTSLNSIGQMKIPILDNEQI
jgi:hypothetical protein